MDRENLKCLRCGAAMKSAGRETIQLGQTGWLLGDLPNLLAGGLDVDIRLCPSCGKLEFFCGEEEPPALPQKKLSVMRQTARLWLSEMPALRL